MSHALERIRQIMDCIVSEKVFPLVAASSQIEQATQCLGDELSRNIHDRELSFLILRQIIGDAAAYGFAGGLGAEEWKSALRTARESLADGRIPSLETPIASGSAALAGLYASVFVMNAAALSEAAPREGDVMLDIGARYGETSVWALGRGVAEVRAFEADRKAFGFLCRNAEHLGRGRIMAENALPADRDGALPPEDGGKKKIPLVRMDDWCEERQVRPGFIRVDLAGGALAAIVGAQRVIRTQKPRMAVNVSHALGDMWNVPLALKQLVPEYRLACRASAPAGGVMLYAAV
ncbi:MAG: FkbM family methyltransferase [Desulfovibrionaceae bacterium]|nr:FkbM family methyltransferase [Desulfovibrionaceae bacterium]